MTDRWLILADDLTGAADCAVAFARRGIDTMVSWDGSPDGDPAVLAIDVDSRLLPASEAAARQVAAQSAHWRSGMRLYKKIDSTLRGQPAAELAAQLAALAAGAHRAPLAVVAPAFPAAGRHTRGGRIVVDGQPLEDTALWARDHTYAGARLPDVLASVGLSAEVIALDTLAAGAEPALARMRDAEQRGIDAVVCDSATTADLAVVAQASLRLGRAVWVGSAGLATALAARTQARGLQQARHRHPGAAARPEQEAPAAHGPVLIVVGTLAEPSRQQARRLAQRGTVTHVAAVPEMLLAGGREPAWRAVQTDLGNVLAAGRDVLLEIGWSRHPDPGRGVALAAALAELVAEVAPAVGGFVITGGQTARALLSRLGVHGIRLIDEIEPGVPLGVTSGALRLPVVTKAGAFGDADTLRRCLVRLKSSIDKASG